MEETPLITEATNSGFDVLQQQLEVLLVYLFRASVQEQLILMTALLVGAWVGARLLRLLDNRLSKRLLRDRSEETRNLVLERLLPAIEQLYYPLLVLAGIIAFVPRDETGRPTGILVALFVFFFVVTAYQVTITILYLVFSRRVFERYHNRVLTPLFYTVLIIAAVGLVIDLGLIASIRLFVLYETPITVGRLGSAALVFYIFIIAGWVIQDALRLTLEQIEQEESLRRSVMTVSRFFIVALGILLTLVALGFNVATLAAIAGGLSLGAGLGLQRIVANFFSGIVLIFEQSIRPGDMIEFDGKLGLVERLNIRATTFRTFDNVDLIIPNENLLTSTLVTHVNEVGRKRVTVNVGVDYDSNPTEVRDILLETALRHGLVLEDPAPFVYFKNYGDSALDFTLWAWVGSLDQRFPTENDLRYMIWQAFKERGITIPFPQTDVHLKVDEVNIPFEMRARPQAPKLSAEDGKQVEQPAAQDTPGEPEPPSRHIKQGREVDSEGDYLSGDDGDGGGEGDR